ncbi:MAG: hypothetical protein PF690_05435 [Deltaproteobacteria bacterium]|jgi:hypothetical protein|nr:hypothetical protein [Deltaproteobacteria bacterium]
MTLKSRLKLLELKSKPVDLEPFTKPWYQAVKRGDIQVRFNVSVTDKPPIGAVKLAAGVYACQS